MIYEVNDEMKDNEIFKLKQELSEVKDLVQEVLRRFGELEFRGLIKYGQPNNISKQEVSFDVKLSRLHKGKLVREVVMEEKKSWDKLKEIKLDIPKSSNSNRKVKANDYFQNVEKKEREKRKVSGEKRGENDLPKVNKENEKEDMVKEFQLTRIDELEWLNLLKEIRTGMDAFQNGNFKLETTREQISSVILNRVKKWLKNKEL
jgi:actin-related protein